MKVLVTGAGGMLGREVAVAAARAGHRVAAPPREDLDVTDADAVRRRLALEQPDAVVNCAAYTDVDGAESEPEAAFRLNAAIPALVAAAAKEVGSSVVHISSDYVFDGRTAVPYPESATPAPLSAYGESKLAGEAATAEANPRHFVVRSAWLFGRGGRNFVDTMLTLAQEREEVRVVHDQIGSPTNACDLAEALLELLATGAHGLHHIAGSGACSWAELASETFRRTAADCRVVPVSTEEMPRPAKRPSFSALRTERPETPRLRPWQEGLEAYLASRAVRPQAIAVSAERPRRAFR